ncbi:MAG: hypothetical protein ACYDBB_11935 [Armatimonadota bacterium]
MSNKHLFLMAALLTITILVAGCTDRTRIAKILDNPDLYLNKEVTIAGTITKTYKVDLIIAETGAYQVDDGSGKIWVITRSSVPSEGTKVGLKGTVSDKINLFGQTITVVIREKDRRTTN